MVYAEVQLIHSAKIEMAKRHLIGEDEINQVRLNMLVDSGAYMMAINESICHALNLQPHGKRKAEMADSSIVEYDVVGPIEVRFKNRDTSCNALVLPGDSYTPKQSTLSAVSIFMQETNQITHYTLNDLLSMETRYRAAFINSLSGFKSASLIGSIDAEGNTNLAIFSSIVHLGANPALIGFINRPDSTERHTLDNILATKFFTINHIHHDFFEQAHQTSARYPKSVSEFDATQFTPQFSEVHPAPYVFESSIKYGLELMETHRLEINGTILVIGKVIEVFIQTPCVLEHGAIDIEKAGTITVSGLDAYHRTEQLARLQYAKPDKPVQRIS